MRSILHRRGDKRALPSTLGFASFTHTHLTQVRRSAVAALGHQVHQDFLRSVVQHRDCAPRVLRRRELLRQVEDGRLGARRYRGPPRPLLKVPQLPESKV